MSFPSPTFVKWLTKHLADLTEAGIITRFELIHKIESEHAERLDIWRNDADSGHAPQELAQEIQDAICAPRTISGFVFVAADLEDTSLGASHLLQGPPPPKPRCVKDFSSIFAEIEHFVGNGQCRSYKAQS